MQTYCEVFHLGYGVNSIADENGSVEDQVIHREMMTRILKDMHQLKPKEFAAFQMFYIDNETYASIARDLRTSPLQAKIYVRRTKCWLCHHSKAFKEFIMEQHLVRRPKLTSCSECEYFSVVENDVQYSVEGISPARFEMWCKHPDRAEDDQLIYSIYDATSDDDADAIRTFETSYDSDCPMADVQKWLQFKNLT